MKRNLVLSALIILMLILIYGIYIYEKKKSDRIFLIEYKVDRLEKIITKPFMDEEPSDPTDLITPKLKCYNSEVRHGKDIIPERISLEEKGRKPEKGIETS